MGLSKVFKNAGKSIKGFFDDLSGKTEAEARRDASAIISQFGEKAIRDIDDNLFTDLTRLREGSAGALSALRGKYGEAGELIDQGASQAFRALQGGAGRAEAQAREQAGQGVGRFESSAALADPALASLSATGTASGRGQELQNILADPSLAGFFQGVQDRTANKLSDAGLRRSGAGAQMSNEDLINAAIGFEGEQRARQQQQAGLGFSALQGQAGFDAQLAPLLSSIRQGSGRDLASVISSRFGDQANLLTGLAGEEAKGLQSGLASELELRRLANQQRLSAQNQMASGVVGSGLGAAQAETQGAANTAQAAGSIGTIISNIWG